MEQKQEMHDVVEMLLSRMRDYPEDFVGDPADYRDMTENKWKKALRLVSGVVAPHEKEALDIRLEEARRAVYMGAALKVMLSPDEPMEEEDYINKKQYKYQTSSQLVFSGNGNVGLGSGISTTGISTSSTILDAASYINQLESRLKQVERQYATNNA